MFCELLLSYSSFAGARSCSYQDYKYAKESGGYYSPQDAYNFGKQIQSLVQKEDLQGLFSLVGGELNNGPRKSFIQNKKFSDIFSKSWREQVLKNTPTCSPIGWRGFSLNDGLIWFNITNSKWHIFSINGAKEELLPKSTNGIGLKVDGKLLPYSCFTNLWYSEDSYKEYFSKFKLSNYKDFIANPGKYFDKNTVDLSKIYHVNEVDNINSDKSLSSIHLAQNLYECSNNMLSNKINNNYIYEEKHSDNAVYRYKVLGRLSAKNHKQLAPYLYSNCSEVYLIELGDNSGGSMGWQNSYTIYGVFTFRDKNRYIIPLKNFSNKNIALNYLELSS